MKGNHREDIVRFCSTPVYIVQNGDGTVELATSILRIALEHMETITGELVLCDASIILNKLLKNKGYGSEKISTSTGTATLTRILPVRELDHDMKEWKP